MKVGYVASRLAVVVPLLMISTYSEWGGSDSLIMSFTEKPRSSATTICVSPSEAATTKLVAAPCVVVKVVVVAVEEVVEMVVCVKVVTV